MVSRAILTGLPPTMHCSLTQPEICMDHGAGRSEQSGRDLPLHALTAPGSERGPAKPGCIRLGPGFLAVTATANSTSDGIERHRAPAEENQGEGYGSERQGKLVASVAQQTILPVHFPNGDAHVDQDCEGSTAGEQAEHKQDTAEELGGSGEIGEPAWQTQAVH